MQLQRRLTCPVGLTPNLSADFQRVQLNYHNISRSFRDTAVFFQKSARLNKKQIAFKVWFKSVTGSPRSI